MCFNCSKPKGLPPPADLEDISAAEIQDILKQRFNTTLILLSDSIYSTTNILELKRFLTSDDTSEYRYVSEYYDCDDFSYRLMGQVHNVEWGALPFGIVWLTKEDKVNHALNIFIDNDHEIWLIEPQNDVYFVCPTAWIPYIVII
jgi:hypothetical protein